VSDFAQVLIPGRNIDEAALEFANLQWIELRHRRSIARFALT
jgi:hypothetical protein